MSPLRDLPSVDRLLASEACAPLLKNYGRGLVTTAIRGALEAIRLSHSDDSPIPDKGRILERVRQRLEAWTTPSLTPVINATGVIIHTNLGRAPLSADTLAAMAAAGEGYTNLEYDLERGKRGSRYDHAEELICRLTGAKAALVVNNNAAAVLLVLSALARRRRVLISRTQLIEIGGGFRIPEVMAQSGAKLVEIGATNRVHLRDYRQALEEQPIRIILSAHRSNFQIVGFTTEPQRSELAALAKEFGVPYVEDLGSGTLIDTAAFGLAHEPTVQESLAAGADVVTFSGDKLLGGPQAGIIAGRAGLIARMKKHPLARAVRADKITYAGLSATLLHYVRGEVLGSVPIWKMISASPAELQGRAERWASELVVRGRIRTIEVITGESKVGGGSLPGATLQTSLLALGVQSVQSSLAAMRKASPPVIARAQDGRILLDPRCVLPEQDVLLIESLKRTLNEP